MTRIKPAKLLDRAGAEALRAGEIVHHLRDFVQRSELRRERIAYRSWTHTRHEAWTPDGQPATLQVWWRLGVIIPGDGPLG